MQYTDQRYTILHTNVCGTASGIRSGDNARYSTSFDILDSNLLFERSLYVEVCCSHNSTAWDLFTTAELDQLEFDQLVSVKHVALSFAVRLTMVMTRICVIASSAVPCRRVYTCRY